MKRAPSLHNPFLASSSSASATKNAQTKRRATQPKPTTTGHQLEHERNGTSNLPLLSIDNYANVQLFVCDSLDRLEPALQACSGPIVSMDCEWNVVMRRGHKQPPVSLVQIYNGSQIGLFRINKLTRDFSTRLPRAMSEWMENPNVRKVGMNIRGDANKLNRDFGVHLAEYIELSHLAKETFPEKLNSARPSLKLLTELFLGHTLDKSSDLRCTNWDLKHDLSEELLQYAATDALAGLEVYRAMHRLRWCPKVETFVRSKNSEA
ncbi:ribonuclease H-like domain-containing protein [Chytriomyces sp. MP71]|nr:ribonuclease H-like domain-containing protein [Chytriomyces sp. MP71]